MTDFIVKLFHYGTYTSSILMLSIGVILTISLFMYPLWFLLNNVIYKRTKAAIYFISYVRHRKSFIKWYKESTPDVNSGEIKNKDF